MNESDADRGIGDTQMTGRSSSALGNRAPVSPASVAARIKRRTTASPLPAVGWGTSATDLANPGDATANPGDATADPGDATAGSGPDGVEMPGRRIGGPRRLSGGVAGMSTSSGSAPMGGRTPARDLWGDGMINEADRGGAHDY